MTSDRSGLTALCAAALLGSAIAVLSAWPEPAQAQGSRIAAGDAAAGMRAALTDAIATASKRLGAQDGYFADTSVRIPLPGKLAEVQNKLKPFGMSGALDDLQLRINRAAEASAPQLGREIQAALKAMTLEDAVSILRGGDTSATEYLRKEAEPGLRTTLKPHFMTALADAGALRAYESVARKYGAGAVAPNAKDWLADQAVSGALNGMFYTIGREEAAIRANPARRTSDLLRRVFGG